MGKMNHNSPRGLYGGGGSLGNYWSHGEKTPDEYERDRLQARRESVKCDILHGRLQAEALAELDAQLLRERASPLIRRILSGVGTEDDLKSYQELCAEGDDVACQVGSLYEEIRQALIEARETRQQLHERKIVAVNQAAEDLRELKVNGSGAKGLNVAEWRERILRLKNELVACDAPFHYIRECEGMLQYWERHR